MYRADVLLVILMAEKLLEAFMKNHCKRLIKQDLGWKKKFIKVINYMSNEKLMIIHLMVGLIKKDTVI